MTSVEEVIKTCDKDDVSLVRLLYTGNDGIPRGRVVDADHIESVLDNGINLSAAMQSFNSLDNHVSDGLFGTTGEVRLIPDPDTFHILPYADRAAVMLCDLYDLDRTPWDADPRSSLTEFLDDSSYEAGVAFESEFYFTNKTENGDIVPFDNSACFSADGMQNSNEIILDIIDALKEQDMDTVAYYPEYGPGQQELVVKYDTGLQAADNHILFKQTVKGVTSNHDINTTFVPKPFTEAAGAGCHIHVSLWEDGDNVFYDSDDSGGRYNLSEIARHFIGGVLEHAPSLVALTAPTVSSYRRLRPHTWASAFTCWGQDNREAIVRVPSSQWEEPSKTTRFEFKPADNTANPYLAELGLLAAGMDGVEREIDPGTPVSEDPADMSAVERADRGIQRLPETLGDALDELEDDEVLADAMGETLFQSYLEVKWSQWREFTDTVADWEIDELTRMF